MNTAKQFLYPALFFVLGAFLVYALSHRSSVNGNFSQSQKEEIQSITREYFIKNPSILQEAAIALQRKSQEEQIELAKKIISANPEAFTQKDAPVIGNPDGEITLVEFLDYNCSHCKQMRPIIDALIKENPSLRVVIQQYPISGEGSLFAAKAALAANLQGKFDLFHEALLESTVPLNEESVIAIAEKKGLDIEQLKKEIDSDEVMQALRESITLGAGLSLRGTPFFTVLKSSATSGSQVEVIPGAAQQGYIQQMIDQVKKTE